MLHKSLQLSQGKFTGNDYNSTTRAMMKLNLGETAAEILKTTPYDYLALLALHQWDEYAATVRVIFPRNDNDILGLSILGNAEAMVANTPPR